jgi:hypothetical protein
MLEAAAATPARSVRRLLVPAPGAAISNLRDVRRPGGGASGLGAIGFLAAPAGARDWSLLSLVSNRHVLFAHGAAAGDPVYQPGYEMADGLAMFSADEPPMASLAEGGLEGHWDYAYPGEDARRYFVDCAAAVLDRPGPRRAGSGRLLFGPAARASRSDAFPGRGIGVYKLGLDAGISGRLVAVDATVALADGTRRDNNLVIRGLRGEDGAERPFARQGDSGALVLDARHRPIGLLWGVSLANPAEAYACHIHPVLDCLKLVPFRRALPGPVPPREEPRDGRY